MGSEKPKTAEERVVIGVHGDGFKVLVDGHSVDMTVHRYQAEAIRYFYIDAIKVTVNECCEALDKHFDGEFEVNNNTAHEVIRSIRERTGVKA